MLQMQNLTFKASDQEFAISFSVMQQDGGGIEMSASINGEQYSAELSDEKVLVLIAFLQQVQQDQEDNQTDVEIALRQIEKGNQE